MALGRSKPMQRKAPMARAKGLPPARQARQVGEGYTLRPRPVAQAAAALPMAKPVPKAVPLQHAGYMAVVRGLRCYRCGLAGFSQFCHADEGKGGAIKSDCRLGWPGCGPRPGINGCHYDIGTARVLPREERRAFEREAGRATRAEVWRLSKWPASLPRWPEDDATALAECEQLEMVR